MIPGVVTTIALAAALGAGIVGGVFFAFSSFVMAALGRLPPAHGVAAMQAINVTVLNRWFLGVFLGTAAACVGLAASALLAWDEAGAGLRLAGAVLYLAGTFAVTIACNVPRNEALAAVAPESADAAVLWSRYQREWTAWNHVRTAAAVAAALLLTLAAQG